MLMYSPDLDSLYAFLPKNTLPAITDILKAYPVSIKITKERKTKLGDYRWLQDRSEHRISVNKSLNPYAFLITLVHEIAHLTTYDQYKRRVKPHGLEWKQEFKQLMLPFFSQNIFPEDITKSLAAYIRNPKASSCTDISLMKILRNYDKDDSSATYLEEIAHNTRFQTTNGRIFIKGDKMRKRYKCVELATQRLYLFSPIAEVVEISDFKG